MIEGGEAREMSISSTQNIRLFQVIPSEVYWPATVEAIGENFDGTCYCQLSLISAVVELETEFTSSTSLRCNLEDFRV